MFDSLAALSSMAGCINDLRIKSALRMIASIKDISRAGEIYNRAVGLIRLSPVYIATVTSKYPFKCPPSGLVAGEIRLGHVFNPVTSMKYPVGLMMREMLQHTQIIGRSGAGKTILIILILMQFIIMKIPFWLFDFKKDYRSLIRHGDVLVLRWSNSFKFNLFSPPPGTDFMSWLIVVRDVLFDIFFPQYPAESTKSVFFETALCLYRKNGKLNIYDLMNEFRRKMNDKSVHSSTKERIRTLLNRFEPMMHILGSVFDCDEGYPIQSLMERAVILELDGLGTDYQNLLSNLISQWMFLYRMNNNQRGRQCSFIVIDESHRLLSGNNAFIRDFIRLSREFGLGLLYANQTLDLDHCVLANTYTVIALSISSTKDRNQMGYNLNLNPEQSDVLANLKQRQAIIRLTAGRYSHPYLFILPELQIEKSISDKEVMQYMEPRLASLNYAPRQPEKTECESRQENNSSGSAIRKDEKLNPLAEHETLLLNDIRNRPFMGVAGRYADLGITNYMGNKVCRQLLQKGFISEVKIKTSPRGRPETFYELTSLGVKTVGLQNFGSGKGGFEHVFSQQRLQEFFSRQGCEAVIEEFRNGKACDVGLTKNSRKTALEIACSHFEKELSNIEKDIAAGWKEVWIISSTFQIMESVKSDWEKVKSQYPDDVKVEFHLLSDPRFYLANDSESSMKIKSNQGGEAETNK